MCTCAPRFVLNHEISETDFLFFVNYRKNPTMTWASVSSTKRSLGCIMSYYLTITGIRLCICLHTIEMKLTCPLYTVTKGWRDSFGPDNLVGVISRLSPQNGNYHKLRLQYVFALCFFDLL